MADQKITELTELTTPALADLLAIVDDPSGTPLSKKVTLANILALFNSNYLQYRDQKAQNTAGGTFTSGAWQTRDLTTEVSDVGGFGALSSNQITLAAGTYLIRASAPGWKVNRHQLRLQNVTDASTVLIGQGTYTFDNGAGDGSQSLATLQGLFTIAASKALELQHQCQTTVATKGFGVEANFTTEVYAVVELWKIG